MLAGGLRQAAPLRLPHPMVAGYIVASVVWVGAILLGVISAENTDAMNFYDHLSDPYAVHDYAGGAGVYYSPPVVAVMQVLAIFGRQAFFAILVALGLAAVGWIGGKWAFLLLFFPPVWWDLSSGNVNTVIGACIAASVTRGGWLVIPALTKVTPAITGLWYLVRRDRERLEEAAIWILGLTIGTFALAPGVWFRWADALLSNGVGYIGPGYFTIPIPLLPRLVVAMLLVIWAAKKDRPRLLPIAGMLAVPVLWWSAIAIGVAALRPSFGSTPAARRSDR